MSMVHPGIRKRVASLLAAGALVSGVGSAAAFADTTSQPSAPAAATGPAHAKRCEKAPDRLQKLGAGLTKLDARLDKLAQARAKAVAAHNDDLVKKIDARIDKLHTHHAAVEARIDAIRKACP
jgi:hypothetical protein